MAITTQQEFIDFAFRRLGAPVLQVNIDPQQAIDCLSESLDYMRERHFDFTERAQFVVPVTNTDITNKYFDVSNFGMAIGAKLYTGTSGGTGYWPVASDIRTITAVNAPSSQVGDYMFDLRYQLTLFDFFGLYFNQGAAANPMGQYMEAMSYIALINDVFNYPASFQHTRTTNRLFLETDYSKLQNSQYILVEATVQINPDYQPKIWEDRIFQKHYRALLKQQWAQNLSKMTGVPLPGGAMMNAAAMSQEANRELDIIEATLLKTHELPLDPLIG